jgi:hypothetical protein
MYYLVVFSVYYNAQKLMFCDTAKKPMYSIVRIIMFGYNFELY